MKSYPLFLTLSLLLLAGCTSVDGTDRSTLSSAATGAVGAYAAGVIDPRDTGDGSDGFLYQQHQQAANRR